MLRVIYQKTLYLRNTHRGRESNISTSDKVMLY